MSEDRTSITESYRATRSNVNIFLDEFFLKLKNDNVADFNLVEKAWKQTEKLRVRFTFNDRTGVVRRRTESEQRIEQSKLDAKWLEQMEEYSSKPAMRKIIDEQASRNEMPLFESAVKDREPETFITDKKFKSRQWAFKPLRNTVDYLKPYKYALLLPSTEMADVVQGMHMGKFNRDTQFLFVESIAGIYDDIKENWKTRLEETAERMNLSKDTIPELVNEPRFYKGHVEDLGMSNEFWSDLEGKLNYVWLDLKGNCQPILLQWMARILMKMMADNSTLCVTTHAEIWDYQKTNISYRDQYRELLSGGFPEDKGAFEDWQKAIDLSLDPSDKRRYGMHVLDNIMIGAALNVGAMLNGEGCALRYSEWNPRSKNNKPMMNQRDWYLYAKAKNKDKMVVHKFHVNTDLLNNENSQANNHWGLLNLDGFDQKMVHIMQRLIEVCQTVDLPSYKTDSKLKQQIDRLVKSPEEYEQIKQHYNSKYRL